MASDGPHRASTPWARQPALRIVAFLTMIAVGVLISSWLIAHTDSISSDGPEYIDMARQWSASPAAVVRNFDYHVGYPVAIVGVHWALQRLGHAGGPLGWDVSAQIVSLLAGAAAMAALWILAEIAFGWRVALVTTMAFGVSRHWTILAADVMSDALAIAFELWAAVFSLWALRRLQDRSRRALGLAAITGLCVGLGYLVRPESLALLVLACGLWIFFRYQERLDWRRTAGAVLTATLVTAACAVPYMIAIGAITKKKRLSDIVLLPHGSFLPLALVDVKVQGYSPPFALLTQFGEAMNWVLFGFAGGWLVMWTINRKLRDPMISRVVATPTRSSAVLMLGATGLLAPLLMGLYAHAGYLDYRHVLFLAMLLSPLAGAGGIFVADGVELLLVRRHVPWGTAIKLVVLGLVCAQMSRSSFRPLHAEYCNGRLAADRIAAELKPDDFVLTNSGLFLHYCGHAGLDLGSNPTTGQIMRRIRRSPPAVSLLALGNSYLAANPALAGQLHTPAFTQILSQPTGADSLSVFRVNRAAAGEIPR
jgi:hypothetical protein